MSQCLSTRLKGIIPALPTPLTDKREVDVQGLQKVVRHVLSNRVNGLWVLGSSGEFATLSDEERKLIMEVCVNETRQATATDERAPVIVGISDNDPRKVIRYAETASSVGADACFLLLPFYFALDAQEAVRYLKNITRLAPLPIIIYDNPLSTKVKLPVKTFLGLHGDPNIVGFKDSSSDYNRFQELVFVLRQETGWKMFQGDERLVGSSLLWGADGAVAALASVAPKLFAELYAASRRVDINQVLSLQKKIFALTRLFEVTGEPTDGAFFAGLKAALRVLGICGSMVSSPFSPLPESKMAEVEKLLEACGVR